MLSVAASGTALHHHALMTLPSSMTAGL